MERIAGEVVETKMFEQLGIFVLDGSGSMSGKGETDQTKAEEVNRAVRDVVARLQSSRNRNNFALAMVSFDEKVKADRVKPTPVTELDKLGDYNPLHGHGGETAIGDALEAAFSVATSYLSQQKDFPRSVVIVVMTDGHNNHGVDPASVAERIKSSGKRISICCAAYGRDKDIDAFTLQKLSSFEGGYVRAYDPEHLRQFFEASVSRLATA